MCERLSFGELREHLGENVTGTRPVSVRKITEEGIRPVISWDNHCCESVKVRVGNEDIFSHEGRGKCEMIGAFPYGRNMGAYQADVASHAVVVTGEDGNVLLDMSTHEASVEVIKDSASSTALMVFEDGTVFYRADGRETLFSIRECGDYEYRFSDDAVARVSQESLYETEWKICLVMHAEDRIFRNISSDKKEILWGTTGDYTGESGSYDKNSVLWSYYLKEFWRYESEADRLGEALSVLDEHEIKLLDLYYNAGMSQTEIARYFGCSRECVCRRMGSVLRKVQRNFG